MANLAFAPLVNAKVYRHFAAVTIAVTLCVAMFANGEARQAVSEPIVREQQAAKLRDADVKKFGVKKLGDRRLSAGIQGGFGEDFDPSYGDGSDPDSLSGSNGTPPADDLAQGGDAVSPTTGESQPSVLSPDEVAALSSEQYRAYLRRLRHRQSATQEREPHDLAAIEAGSLARSGSLASD